MGLGERETRVAADKRPRRAGGRPLRHRWPDAAAALAALVATGAWADPPLAPRLELHEAVHDRSGTPQRSGFFHVFEDRAAGEGRILKLEVVVLPALESPRAPDPVFAFAGGPGQNVAAHVGTWARHWARRRHDVVLVSQRGTGGDNRLACELPGSDADLQGYLEPIFNVPAFRGCLDELRRRADLRRYSTFQAMEDADELRQALGYEIINLIGGSYGSRAALIFMRLHPQRVRCAILNGVAPPAFRNPLFHARSAQQALDRIFELNDAKAERRAIFGDLRAKLDSVLARLDRQPVEANVRHPVTGEAVRVRLTRDAFAEALRTIMYSGHDDVARLILRAHEGDFEPFAQAGLLRNRALRDSLAFGMLLCVTCAEDVARIDPDEIERETRGTFLGDGRVRRQMEVCRFWPRSELPADFGAPVQVSVPALLLSGAFDPVTPPRWGDEAASHLPNATHVVVPGSHGVGGTCVESIMRAFLEDPGQPLDTSCVAGLEPAPFRLPDERPN
jgi:pimeloyl-ACP methyl ester carboxylesterase